MLLHLLRGLVPQAAVRSDLVVVNAPLLDDLASIGKTHEPVLIEALIPEPPVEALHDGMLDWLARLDSNHRSLRPRPGNAFALLSANGQASGPVQPIDALVVAAVAFPPPQDVPPPVAEAWPFDREDPQPVKTRFVIPSPALVSHRRARDANKLRSTTFRHRELRLQPLHRPPPVCRRHERFPSNSLSI